MAVLPISVGHSLIPANSLAGEVLALTKPTGPGARRRRRVENSRQRRCRCVTITSVTSVGAMPSAANDPAANWQFDGSALLYGENQRATVVEPVARTMAAYLAQFSSNAKCDLIYWAVDPAGDGIDRLVKKILPES